MSSPALLLCATEISGDARGARLAGELRRLAPDLRLHGLGGDRMRRAGVDVLLDVTHLGTVGWFDHWPDLPRYLSALRLWRREVRQKPAAAIVIDAPGISYPFARVAAAAGVQVIYFVTPQTWLWNPQAAVERLRAHADIVVPTLAAEAEIYERAGLRVVYEGHPALDDLLESRERVKNARFHASIRQHESDGAVGARIGVLPGSRRHAVARLLPPMLAAANLLADRMPVGGIAVSAASPPLRRLIDAERRGGPEIVRVVEGDLWSVLASSHVVLSSTGGSLLDAAFADVPAVAAYRVDPVTHWIAKHVMRLDARLSAFALPNLLANERIVPEFIQDDVTAHRLADAATRLLTDTQARESVCRGYEKVRAALGTPGVNARIAERLLRELGLRPVQPA